MSKAPIDELFALAEAAALTQEPAPPPIPVYIPPDALVFCKLVYKCNCCHREYEAPNGRLLVRRGTNYLHIDQWMAVFNTIPRERIEREQKTDTCDACFDGGCWKQEDFDTHAVKGKFK